MATIDDIGEVNEPLSAPALGGPNGWAAAVRDRLKAIESSLTSGLAGKVDKSGSDDVRLEAGAALIFDVPDARLWPLYDANGAGNPDPTQRVQMALSTEDGNRLPLHLGNPVDASHAATKGYVDNILAGAGWHIETGQVVNGSVVTFARPFATTPIVVFGVIAWVEATEPQPTVTTWDNQPWGFKTIMKVPNGSYYTGGGAASYLAIGPSA